MALEKWSARVRHIRRPFNFGALLVLALLLAGCGASIKPAATVLTLSGPARATAGGAVLLSVKVTGAPVDPLAWWAECLSDPSVNTGLCDPLYGTWTIWNVPGIVGVYRVGVTGWGAANPVVAFQQVQVVEPPVKLQGLANPEPNATPRYFMTWLLNPSGKVITRLTIDCLMTDESTFARVDRYTTEDLSIPADDSTVFWARIDSAMPDGMYLNRWWLSQVAFGDGSSWSLN